MRSQRRSQILFQQVFGERGAALLLVMSVALIIVALAAPLSITQLNLSRQHSRAREAYKTIEIMEQIGKVVLRSYEVQQRTAGGNCPAGYYTRGKFCFPRAEGTGGQALFCVEDYESGGESELCISGDDIRLMGTASLGSPSDDVMVVQVEMPRTEQSLSQKLITRLYRTLDRWEGRDPMDSIQDLYGMPRAYAYTSGGSGNALEPWLHNSVTSTSTNMGRSEPASAAACVGTFCVTCAAANTECVEIQICPVWKDGNCTHPGDYYRQRFAVFD